jgi:hypothetical protein
MIKNSLLCGVSLFLMSSSAWATVTKTLFKERGLEGVRYEVRVDGIQAGVSRFASRSQSLQQFRLTGVEPYGAITYRPGFPQLPVVRILIQGEVAVTADPSVQERTLSSGARIEPSLAPVLKLPGQKFHLFLDPKAYESDQWMPGAPYSVSPAGFRDGQPLQLVTLYPIAYQAKSGKWSFRQNFTVVARRRPVVTHRAEPLFAFVVGAKFASSPSLASYIGFKQKQGYRVVTGVMGKDFSSPDTIRKWLQAQLANGLKYAMIVGDAEDVPARPSTVIKGVTDHFYRAIDTNDYTQDINGPDIGLGRVSVASEAQLQTVVSKFIRYQSTRKLSWTQAASFVATDDQYQVAEGTHNYVIQNYTSKLGFQGTFPSVSAAQGGDRLYAITHHAATTDLLKAFHEGRAIIDYSGHGATTYWAGPQFTPNNIAAIANEEALPFVIGNACITGQFTVPESFGESWLRSPYAIGYWGSMDNTLWTEDDILEKKMFDGIFQFGQVRLGDFTNYALSALWNHFGGQGKSTYYWETYVLFGDPSIALRIK